MDLKITTLKVGDLPTNTYIGRIGSEAFLVDPGDDADAIIDELRSQKIKLKYILLTHAHFDHVLALDEIKKSFPEAFIVLHEDDVKLLHELPAQGIFSGHVYKKITSEVFAVSEGVSLPFGQENIRVLATPGHTIGSVSFFITGNLFSGDTLFYHTYGRLDLPHSAPKKMKDSLLKLLSLPKETRVFPGHGRPTTVKSEREFFGLK